MRRAALTLFAIISAFIFPSVYELAQPGPVAGATPTLSGAKVAYIPNADFSGVGLGQVGTPPDNYGFETAGGGVGTPVSNHDFENGLTDWTTTGGTPTILTGGPTGDYVELGTSDRILSEAFTVDDNAETLAFDFSSPGGSYNVYVDIKHGAGYSSTSSKGFSTARTSMSYMPPGVSPSRSRK